MCDTLCDALVRDQNGVYLDATFGCGGHSQGHLSRLSTHGQLMARDQDPAAKAYVPDDRRFTFLLYAGNFSAISAQLYKQDGPKTSGIANDCGVSSPQLDREGVQHHA